MYCAIRGRLHLEKHCIVNMHPLAIHIYDRHIAEGIFGTDTAASDVLCPSWKDIIIGVSTGGESKMTVHISGVATLFQNVTKEGFICIWSDAHQLDLVL